MFVLVIDTRNPGRMMRLALQANAVLTTLSHTTPRIRCGNLILGQTDALAKIYGLGVSLAFDFLSILPVWNENFLTQIYFLQSWLRA